MEQTQRAATSLDIFSWAEPDPLMLAVAIGLAAAAGLALMLVMWARHRGDDYQPR